MQITSNSCQELQITSPWLEEWILNYGNTNFILKFIINHNNTISEIDIDTNLNFQSPYNFTLEASEGVYSIELKRFNNDNTTQTDFACYFQECNLNCELADKLSQGCEITYRLLNFLRSINECNECDCNYAFIAYNKLKKEMKQIPLKETFNDCNC